MYYRDQKFIKSFGARVEELRKSRNMTQEQLAYETGFELSQIGRIERGLVNTSISHAAAIAKALKVEVPELFTF